MKDSKHISTRQAYILCFIFLGSLLIRSLPFYFANDTGSPWLSVLLAVGFLMLFILMLKRILIKYNDKSYIEIMEDIFGIITGRMLGVLYFIYITFLCGYYLRYYAEKLTATLSNNTSYIIFVAIFLVFVSIILKQGLQVTARMGEIFFWFVIVILIALNILMLPRVRLQNFTPITQFDILPSFENSMHILSIFGLILLVFMQNDMISNKQSMAKMGVKFLILITIMSLFISCIPVGIFGEGAKDLVNPYFASIQSVSFLNTIERVEASMISFWAIADFTLIIITIFTALHVLKNTLKLSDIGNLTNIYLVLLFFLAITISTNMYELNVLASKLLIYLNSTFFVGIPIIIFVVGLLRRKI